jgi:hypothetical protein
MQGLRREHAIIRKRICLIKEIIYKVQGENIQGL